jgi:hypothetical protein
MPSLLDVVRGSLGFAVGTWVGSIIYFGAIVAPAAFTVLTADQAGALVGLTLSRLHLLGIIAGVIYLVATAVGQRSVAALVRPAPLLVFLMIVLSLVLQFYVIGTMDALRAQMISSVGSVSGAPAGNPLRASFDRLHTLSVPLEMAVLVSGLAAMVLTVRKPTP